MDLEETPWLRTARAIEESNRVQRTKAYPVREAQRKWREHESVKYSDRDGYISESDLPFYFLFFIFFNYFPFWETQKKVGRNLFFKIGKIWNNIRKKDFRGLTKFWLLIHRCVCKPRYWIDVAIFYWWVRPRYGDSIIALCPVQCWVGIPFCRG